jgi:hypothetical protein
LPDRTTSACRCNGHPSRACCCGIRDDTVIAFVAGGPHGRQ